jgi:hypothetical protein
MSKTSEALLYIDTPYRPEPGSFCKPKGTTGGRYIAGQWYECREIWHYELKDLPLFFYSHISGKTRAVAAFITKVENILDVRPRSHIGPTQRKTICWVEPSSWWTRLAMRRSLFTILLRVAQHYHTEEDNFRDALYSHHYTKNTRYAVERFLNGYTHYTGRKRGWYNQFCILGPSAQEVDGLLISRSS